MTNYIEPPENAVFIKTIYHTLADGTYYYEHVWDGSPKLPGWKYREDKALWGENWEKLPWPVIELGTDWNSTKVFLMRVDGTNWFSACWWKYKDQTRHVYYWWRARILMTLRIWGWSDIKEGDYLTWRSVHLPKCLKFWKSR